MGLGDLLTVRMRDGPRLLRRAAQFTASVVRARTQSRVFVLMYHHVSESRVDPWDLIVSPKRFDRQMEALRRSGRPLLTVAQLGEALAAGELPPRAIVVTFDDGYADNARAALPILERHGVPATVFVTTGSVDSAREMWWDELERIVLCAPRRFGVRRVEVAGEVLELRLDEPPGSAGWSAADGPGCARQAQFLRLWRALDPLTPACRTAVLDDLGDWAGTGTIARETHRMLSSDELRMLSRSSCIQIGSHTVTHADLPNAAGLREELVESRRYLEEQIRTPVSSLAYPSGRVTDEVAAAAALAGYETAMTTRGGAVEPGQDPLQLPRIAITDQSGAAFRLLLTRL